MKKLLLPLFGGILFSTASFAQWNEVTVKAIGDDHAYMDMDFFKSGTGIIAGYDYDTEKSVLYRTTNKGHNWTLSRPNKFYGRDVSCATTQIAYASDYNVLCKTMDAGITWDTIHYSTDQDTQWERASLGELRFVDENNGLALTDNAKLLRTSNKGVTWVTIYETASMSNSVRNFHSKDNKDIYGTAGDPFNNWFIHSADSGATWDSISLTTVNTMYYLNDIYFTNPSTGFIACQSGYLMKTVNGGADWQLIEVDTEYHIDFFHISFLDANNGFITCGNNDTWVTNDGGANWRNVYVDNGMFFVYDLVRSYFFNINEGCARGQGGIIDRIMVNTNVQNTGGGVGLQHISRTNSNFDVFPNPSSGNELTIRSTTSTSNITVEILDLQGRTVLNNSSISAQSGTLDISPLLPGVYLLKLTDTNGTYLSKLIRN